MEHHGHHELIDEIERSVVALSAPRGRECLQRIILPRAGEPLDVRSLYLAEAPTNVRRAHSSARTSLRIGADSEVSFATYFNAFAAAYWRRWSVLGEVVLRLTVRGSGRVDLYRSKIDGSRIAVTGDVVGEPGRADQVTTVEFVCDLGPFEDGGWIWFDLTSDTDVELLAGGWYSSVDAPSTRPDARPDARPAHDAPGVVGTRPHGW